MYCIALHCMWETEQWSVFSALLAVQCNAIHCNALHCWYCTALHCIVALHCIALHCTAIHCNSLHCWYCVALHCSHCIALLHCMWETERWQPDRAHSSSLKTMVTQTMSLSVSSTSSSSSASLSWSSWMSWSSKELLINVSESSFIGSSFPDMIWYAGHWVCMSVACSARCPQSCALALWLASLFPRPAWEYPLGVQTSSRPLLQVHDYSTSGWQYTNSIIFRSKNPDRRVIVNLLSPYSANLPELIKL